MKSSEEFHARLEWLKTREGWLHYCQLIDEIGQLHDKKQADYGTDKDPFANIVASSEFGIKPWIGAMLRLNDKVSRIKSFILRGVLRNEPVSDSMVDIAVYALIAKVLYDRESAD